MIVVDASALLSTALASQSTEAAKAFFSSQPSSWIAPGILAFELGNALLKAERRGMTETYAVDEIIVNLEMAIKLEPVGTRPAEFLRLMNLARHEGLSLFDAAYLDLAEREQAALASRDKTLLDVATRRGVPVYDLR